MVDDLCLRGLEDPLAIEYGMGLPNLLEEVEVAWRKLRDVVMARTGTDSIDTAVCGNNLASFLFTFNAGRATWVSEARMLFQHALEVRNHK